MKFLSYKQHQEEYTNRGIKTDSFYNPDNSVVLFEPQDQHIKEWVVSNIKKLRKDKVFLNPNTIRKIIAHIEKLKAETPVTEIVPAEVAAVETNVFADTNKREEILDALEKATTIKELKKIMFSVVELIG